MSKEEELRQRSSIHLSQKHQKHHKHHMAMPWHDFIPDDDHDLARTASLSGKSSRRGTSWIDDAFLRNRSMARS